MRKIDPARIPYITSSLKIVEKIASHLQFSSQYEDIGIHEPAWQSLGPMINQAIGNLSHEGVEITPLAESIDIYADPLTEKVIYNLLENALRHGGKLTQIRIYSQERPDGERAVIFEDNGVGLPNEEKELIFKHGYGKNTGLGLTLCREILAVTGIRIIETGEPGRGARFETADPLPCVERSLIVHGCFSHIPRISFHENVFLFFPVPHYPGGTITRQTYILTPEKRMRLKYGR